MIMKFGAALCSAKLKQILVAPTISDEISKASCGRIQASTIQSRSFDGLFE